MKPVNTPENRAKCICGDCPLYNQCTEEKKEMLYCAVGKSTCDLDASKPCICGSCPVYAENDLSGGYFCIDEIK
ncbi:MAG: DUF2769 domain-containing protein [Patescibacteria group bacterium]|jgi:hypothetical protein